MIDTLELLDFDHIGIATNNIKKSIKAYTIIGYVTSSPIFIDEIQGVRVCFMKRRNSPKIELIEPHSDNSPINSILEKNNGIIPYHFCYVVVNIEDAIVKLGKQGFVRITRPSQSPAFNSRRVCFLYKREMGIIELLEQNFINDEQ